MTAQESTIQRRNRWVSFIETLTGPFDESAVRIAAELTAEAGSGNSGFLLEHLRLCGAVPEQYGHDSTAEKLYSKYTDTVVSASLVATGLNSVVLEARADAADVQARGNGFSLVADAKAFRLSRTAKNQKDFKIQALDGWRGDLDYALLVCPIYQFPTRASQIYQQAITRNVCILSYSHLAVLVALAERRGTKAAEASLQEILKTVSTLHPGKNAGDYWTGINKSLIASLRQDGVLWTAEKMASLQALEMVKQEALRYLQAERDRLLSLSYQEALTALIRASRIESRAAQVSSVEHGELLGAAGNG